MYYGHSGLYYVAAELDSVVKWEVEQDREKQQVEDLGRRKHLQYRRKITFPSTFKKF